MFGSIGTLAHGGMESMESAYFVGRTGWRMMRLSCAVDGYPGLCYPAEAETRPGVTGVVGAHRRRTNRVCK